MIRIIKTEPHKSIVKEVICRNCGTTLEYTPNDVLVDYTTDYLGDRDYFSYVGCLACTCKVRVERLYA